MELDRSDTANLVAEGAETRQRSEGEQQQSLDHNLLPDSPPTADSTAGKTARHPKPGL